MSCFRILPRCKKFAQSLLGLLLASNSVSTVAQSTWIGGSTYYNAGSAYFNESTGILTIPNLEIFTADGLGDSKIATVTLEQSDVERFTVRNYIERWQPPSCSESEIVAATSLIDLNTSYEEAAAMFSCSPSITQTGMADLQTGKIVLVSWIAGGGIISQGGTVITSFNNYTPFVVTSSSTWLPAPVPTGYLRSPTGTPAISLIFREGELEVISFATGSRNSQRVCNSMPMADLVETLQAGYALNSVNELLGCEGSLISTRIDMNDRQEYYNWVGRQPVFSQLPDIQPPEFHTSVSLQGRFSEDIATGFDGSINRSRQPDRECSIEQLTAASQNVSVGMSEQLLSQNIDCDYSTSNVSFSTEQASTVYYEWQTSIPTNSPLLSLNRRLSVRVTGGVVESVVLSRF